MRLKTGMSPLKGFRRPLGTQKAMQMSSLIASRVLRVSFRLSFLPESFSDRKISALPACKRLFARSVSKPEMPVNDK